VKNFLFTYLCVIIFYAPLPLGANRIWASSSIEILVFTAFLIHLYLVLKGRKALLPPKYSFPILIPLAITLIWLLIQITPGLGADGTISFDPSLTHIMFMRTLSFTLFIWMLFSHIKTRHRLYQLAIAIITTGFFQACYAIWLNLNVDMPSPIFEMPYAERAQGSFIYQNQLANYLALCSSIAIGILVSQLSHGTSGDSLRHKVRDFALVLLSTKMVIRLVLVVIIIALILTRSRMGNSAFFMALAVISLFAFFFYKRKPTNLKLLIISFFFLDLILVGSLFGVEKVQQRLAETSLASETRDEVVRDSIPIINDYPLTGTGGASFYSTFISYHPEPYTLYYDHAHNDYIQFAVELGLPITLMLGVMMLYCLLISLQTMRRRHTSLDQGLAFGCSIAVLHMILHSSVDFSLQSPAVGILFLTILSISVIAAKLPGKVKRH